MIDGYATFTHNKLRLMTTDTPIHTLRKAVDHVKARLDNLEKVDWPELKASFQSDIDFLKGLIDAHPNRSSV